MSKPLRQGRTQLRIKSGPVLTGHHFNMLNFRWDYQDNIKFDLEVKLALGNILIRGFVWSFKNNKLWPPRKTMRKGAWGSATVILSKNLNSEVRNKIKSHLPWIKQVAEKKETPTITTSVPVISHHL